MLPKKDSSFFSLLFPLFHYYIYISISTYIYIYIYKCLIIILIFTIIICIIITVIITIIISLFLIMPIISAKTKLSTLIIIYLLSNVLSFFFSLSRPPSYLAPAHISSRLSQLPFLPSFLMCSADYHQCPSDILTDPPLGAIWCRSKSSEFLGLVVKALNLNLENLLSTVRTRVLSIFLSR